MKTTFQEVLETPNGYRIFTPQVPNYLQQGIIELHWKGLDARQISFYLNTSTHYVDMTIAEFAI